MAIFYIACFTEDDGVYSCGHKHPTVASAMNCLVPDGGSFIRAFENGAYRSLNEKEFIDFLEAIEQMPWHWRNRSSAQGAGA
jgi:histone acetyltransferase (RNA polymerase elongator complex component)